MRVALDALRPEFAFEVEIFDVDADPVLEAKYDELVPVLTDADGTELCHYFLDAVKVREYLSAFS